METAILLFPVVTSLDAIGPYEVLHRIPGNNVRFVAQNAGPQPDENGALQLTAPHSFEDVTSADILLIPGGYGTRALTSDELTLQWVRKLDATTTWTTSVCTGSLVLGAAGLLQGRPATTHWMAYNELAAFGASPTQQRVVFDDKYVTAAGVSAGIDMALELVIKIFGSELASAIQLGIEYDPQPPLDSGSPSKAAPEIVELVRSVGADAQANS
jgi:transcriptional regulator GlxA family with amidase domain